MREEDKIKAGQLFASGHPDLAAIKLKTHNHNVDYNQTYENEFEQESNLAQYAYC